MANKFTFPPAPVATSMQIRGDGIITSPIWLAWLTRALTPVLQAVVEGDTSIAELLLLSRTGAGGNAGADADLSIMAATRQQAQPVTDQFPPESRHAISGDNLAMLAATQSGRQQFPAVLSDTKANRTLYPNSSFPVGTLFIASDWHVTYRNSGTAWVYVSGRYDATLANIPTLGTNDAGFQFGVTDYAHCLTWSGTAWGWTPGDGGSGFDAPFEVDPGTGWHLLDGSVVTYLKSDGTTSTVTLPDETTAFYMKAGSTRTGPNAAVAPTFTGNAATPTGTVAATFTGSAMAPHQHDAPIGVDGGDNIYVLDVDGFGNPYAALETIPGTPDVSAINALRTSADSAGTPAGTVSATFTGNAATPTGTISTTGEPRNYQRKWYFRQ